MVLRRIDEAVDGAGGLLSGDCARGVVGGGHCERLVETAISGELSTAKFSNASASPAKSSEAQQVKRPKCPIFLVNKD